MNYVTAEITAAHECATTRNFRTPILRSQRQSALPLHSPARMKKRVADETIVSSLRHARVDHGGCCRSMNVSLGPLSAPQRDELHQAPSRRHQRIWLRLRNSFDAHAAEVQPNRLRAAHPTGGH